MNGKGHFSEALEQFSKKLARLIKLTT